MRFDLVNTIRHKQIEHVYQPIWNSFQWDILGYEALIRFTNNSLNHNIEEAFALAREQRNLYELDTMSIVNAIDGFPINQLTYSLLFINIFPSTILHLEFKTFIQQLLKKYPLIKGKVVLELNESEMDEAYWDNPEFKEKIAFLKEKNFLIALDDIGKGAITLRKIKEIEPHYLKVDRYFGDDLHSSKEKKDFISVLVNYSKNKMELILEGIEQEIDLAESIILQVPNVQGYLLGKPEKVSNLKFSRHFSPKLEMVGR